MATLLVPIRTAHHCIDLSFNPALIMDTEWESAWAKGLSENVLDLTIGCASIHLLGGNGHQLNVQITHPAHLTRFSGP